MNLKPKLTLAAIMITLIVVGCTKYEEYPEITSNNEPFTFIKAGNEWEYEVYDRTNNELLGIIPVSILDDDEEGYSFNIDVTNAGGMGNYVFKQADKNYWVIGRYSDIFNTQYSCYIALHKDCNKNQEFDACEGVAKIDSIAAMTVTVPAGIFINCIKIRVEYPDGREDFYWVHKTFGNIMIEENNKIFKLKSKNF